jgi:hypothetical protein
MVMKLRYANPSEIKFTGALYFGSNQVVMNDDEIVYGNTIAKNLCLLVFPYAFLIKPY